MSSPALKVVAMYHSPGLLINITVRYHSLTSCQITFKIVAMYHNSDLLDNFNVRCLSMELCQLSFQSFKTVTLYQTPDLLVGTTV